MLTHEKVTCVKSGRVNRTGGGKTEHPGKREPCLPDILLVAPSFVKLKRGMEGYPGP
jgi:hypothetical protein